jgi:hypothetical protein
MAITESGRGVAILDEAHKTVGGLQVQSVVYKDLNKSVFFRYYRQKRGAAIHQG